MASHTTLKATLTPMLRLIESLDSAIASADDALAAAIADDAATMQRLRVLKEKQRVYSSAHPYFLADIVLNYRYRVSKG